MTEAQLSTLRIYKRLIDHQDEWGGELVFCCGEDAARSGAAAAASIAGAATLLVASDVHELKKAYRRGEVDFIVNSLDESVRALKNELRRKRPLSVALVGNVGQVVQEMVDRGVQPNALLMTEAQSSGLRPLIDRGVRVLAIALENGDEREALVFHGERHSEYFVSASSATKLREVDARLLRLMPKDELVRRRWVERVAQYQRSESDGRWVYLSESEAGLLVSEGFTIRSF